MTLDPDVAINALALVVDAVRGSVRLQTWFHEFAHLSEEVRLEAVARTTRAMRAQHASEELVTAFGLLSHPTLFAAVQSALEKCGISVVPAKQRD